MLEEGKALTGARVVLYIAPGGGPAGAAVVAGRRVGTAVGRSRARRILRDAWRALVPCVADGTDVVLVARRTIRGTKTQDLVSEIRALLERGGAIRA